MAAVVAAIISAAKVAAVPPALLLSVCHVESNLRNVVSPADGGSASYGPCQVKLTTARMVAKRAIGPMELMDVETNARIAGAYLAHLARRYRGDWCRAVVAYNRGSAHVDAPSCRNNPYYKRVLGRLKTRPWRDAR